MKPKQECHGARRRLHSRALLGSLVLASASLGACGDDQGVDSADLQAILHDGDLTQIMRSMLTARRPMAAQARAGSTTARGGTGVPGTGAAGSVRRRREGHGSRATRARSARSAWPAAA